MLNKCGHDHSTYNSLTVIFSWTNRNCYLCVTNLLFFTKVFRCFFWHGLVSPHTTTYHPFCQVWYQTNWEKELLDSFQILCRYNMVGVCTMNLYHSEFILKNTFSFSVICWQWKGVSKWNPSAWKTRNSILVQSVSWLLMAWWFLSTFCSTYNNLFQLPTWGQILEHKKSNRCCQKFYSISRRLNNYCETNFDWFHEFANWSCLMKWEKK